MIRIRANVKCFGSEEFELTVNRTARIRGQTAGTLKPTHLFDIVFEPMPNILLYRAFGYDATSTQLRACAYDAVGFFVNPARAGVPRQTFGNVGRLTERARLKEPRKVARPQKHQGEAFRGWPVRPAPRTASPERIGESPRSSGTECAAPGVDGEVDTIP